MYSNSKEIKEMLASSIEDIDIATYQFQIYLINDNIKFNLTEGFQHKSESTNTFVQSKTYCDNELLNKTLDIPQLIDIIREDFTKLKLFEENKIKEAAKLKQMN